VESLGGSLKRNGVVRPSLLSNSERKLFLVISFPEKLGKSVKPTLGFI
jgi:hypothetical protein